ncbi:MAG: hypothetical protein JO157_04675 [Acetobacteraceae bacterium]|nr:hypothetical protein [Acetobacteraceae bacterium]
MAAAKLEVAIWNYDRAEALRDGSVKIEGVETDLHSGRIVTDIFKCMVDDKAYDVAELGLTYFLRTFEVDEPPFLLLPVFPVRSFRHSAIYVNRAAGISRPEDLNGKRIGELALYGHDAGVMPKGMLMDEYGFQPESCRWVIGGIDFPLTGLEWIPQRHPPGVEIRQASPSDDLGAMLERGEIDALISADTPKAILQGSPAVGRLFPDYEERERDYYKRTGVFPIMHGVAVKRELAHEDPAMIRAVFSAFVNAKLAAEQKLVNGMTFNNMNLMVPWFSALLAKNRELLGNDWWPYGVAQNRRSLDAYLRYYHEQGLSKRRITIEEIIVPYLLDT